MNLLTVLFTDYGVATCVVILLIVAAAAGVFTARLYRQREEVIYPPERIFCPIVRTRASLAPAEFAAIARSWADDDARLKVIEDIFDAQQSNLLSQISNPDVARETNGVIFLAGALESLRVMQEQLHTARKTPAPQAEERPQ